MEKRKASHPQLVAAQLQAIWADADALEYIQYIQDAVECKHNDGITAGIRYLLMLPSKVFGGN